MTNFADKLVERATAELTAYDKLVETESPLKERIGVYWTFLNRPDLDGGDNVAWSAAFISYMVMLAGAGDSFPYSAQHSVYFYRTINDRQIKKKSAFWGYRVGEVTIQPGDILGMNRGDAPIIDYDWAVHHADYKSHADIVVAIEGTSFRTIGGNVGEHPGQVADKRFGLTNGRLINLGNDDQHCFVVIRSFLP